MIDVKNEIQYILVTRLLTDMAKAGFLTDEELSKILRVSRRTLQEYRTLGVVPYYLVQGKALYKESDILKILEDSYKRCKEDMRWV